MKVSKSGLLKVLTFRELQASCDRDDMLAILGKNGGVMPRFTIREVGVATTSRKLAHHKARKRPVRGGSSDISAWRRN